MRYIVRKFNRPSPYKWGVWDTEEQIWADVADTKQETQEVADRFNDELEPLTDSLHPEGF